MVTGTKSGESGASLFSRCVPDFCDGWRSFPLNKNSNLYRRGCRQWIPLFINPLNIPAPVPLSRKFQFLTHFPFPDKLNVRRIWDSLATSIHYKSGTVGKKLNPRSSGIFPTCENQALILSLWSCVQFAVHRNKICPFARTVKISRSLLKKIDSSHNCNYP